MIGVDLDNILIQDSHVIEPPSESNPEQVVETSPDNEPKPEPEPEPEPQPEPEPEPQPEPEPEPEPEEDLKEEFPPYMKVNVDDATTETLQTVDKDHPIKMEVVVPVSSTPPKPLPPPPPPPQNRPTGFRMKMRF